jgi:hypothetical protein
LQKCRRGTADEADTPQAARRPPSADSRDSRPLAAPRERTLSRAVLARLDTHAAAAPSGHAARPDGCSTGLTAAAPQLQKF